MALVALTWNWLQGMTSTVVGQAAVQESLLGERRVPSEVAALGVLLLKLALVPGLHQIFPLHRWPAPGGEASKSQMFQRLRANTV